MPGMANKEPTADQPDYDAPGKSGHSAPHGGTGSPSDDAPGQVKKDQAEDPAPNQDLPEDQPEPNQDLPETP